MKIDVVCSSEILVTIYWAKQIASEETAASILPISSSHSGVDNFSPLGCYVVLTGISVQFNNKTDKQWVLQLDCACAYIQFTYNMVSRNSLCLEACSFLMIIYTLNKKPKYRNASKCPHLLFCDATYI
jgi:hypothetical protein